MDYLVLPKKLYKNITQDYDQFCCCKLLTALSLYFSFPQSLSQLSGGSGEYLLRLLSQCCSSDLWPLLYWLLVPLLIQELWLRSVSTQLSFFLFPAEWGGGGGGGVIKTGPLPPPPPPLPPLPHQEVCHNILPNLSDTANRLVTHVSFPRQDVPSAPPSASFPSTSLL